MFVGCLIACLVTIGTWLLAVHVIHFPEIPALVLSLAIAVSISVLLSSRLASIALDPLKLLSQAIVHVDPDHHNTPPPNLETVKLGRELVTSLSLQVYQFASMESTNSKDLIDHRKEVIQASNIVSHLPLPLFVFNKELLVVNASNAALEYCKVESSNLFGKPVFDSLDLEYANEYTLEKWIEDCQNNKVTYNGYWERVRVRLKNDDTVRQCDMSAYFNRDNPSGTDFIITLFDRTDQYNQDDESMSFVALAVHELRTPLTILRGYIEVFEEELGAQLSDELKAYMLKMDAAADQLTSFVHNILNVARIDNNQLSLQLTEGRWEEILQKSMDSLDLRAKVHGKAIELTIAKDLPTVAVDPVSITEVINNLVDNAIKYSPESKRIIIDVKMNANVVETTVQDFGVGIPESVLPNLFEKFYRNHRTKTQIGGTGLGLYLSKAMITAHGGQIWAKSKEGEGTTFGFTLIPYADAKKDGIQDSGDIVRQANGWIKNHSYYRR